MVLPAWLCASTVGRGAGSGIPSVALRSDMRRQQGLLLAALSQPTGAEGPQHWARAPRCTSSSPQSFGGEKPPYRSLDMSWREPPRPGSKPTKDDYGPLRRKRGCGGALGRIGPRWLRGHQAQAAIRKAKVRTARGEHSRPGQPDERIRKVPEAADRSPEGVHLQGRPQGRQRRRTGRNRQGRPCRGNQPE